MRKALNPPALTHADSQIDYLVSIGLKSDEVCNMASISVVLLGLNPETRLKPVVEYLKQRGMPGEQQQIMQSGHGARHVACRTSYRRRRDRHARGEQASAIASFTREHSSLPVQITESRIFC